MDYRILCTWQEPLSAPVAHRHIVAVGTGVDHSSGWTRRWTKDEVIEHIKNGWDTFHTIGVRSGLRARVDVAQCSVCSYYHPIIKTVGDSTTDNNLDDLPSCG